MCVIAIKPIGHRLPSAKEWRTAMQHNSDGAGFMLNLPNGEGVLIRKGFFKQKQMYREIRQALDNLSIEETEVTIALHARICTSGGNVPQNCHPFPNSSVVTDLKATTIIAPVGIAHNGILFTGGATLSDTQMFIRDCLSRYTWADLASPAVKTTLTSLTQGNKFVFLEASGDYVTLGKWTTDADGLLWSNRHHDMTSYWDKPLSKNKVTGKLIPAMQTWSFEDSDLYLTDEETRAMIEAEIEASGAFDNCFDCEYDYEPTPDAYAARYGDCDSCQWAFTPVRFKTSSCRR